jgi:hypothetical protein
MRSIRMVMLAGLIRPMRTLSRGSWMTPCSVSPENPAKSIEMCSRAKACSMKGRIPMEGAANTGGPDAPAGAVAPFALDWPPA